MNYTEIELYYIFFAIRMNITWQWRHNCFCSSLNFSPKSYFPWECTTLRILWCFSALRSFTKIYMLGISKDTVGYLLDVSGTILQLIRLKNVSLTFTKPLERATHARFRITKCISSRILQKRYRQMDLFVSNGFYPAKTTAAIIKSKSATIAFSSSPSFFLVALSFSFVSILILQLIKPQKPAFWRHFTQMTAIFDGLVFRKSARYTSR